MNVSSMTGFGRASGTTPELTWTWEIKSVNGRTLDIRLKLPSRLERLEPVVRRLVGVACQRGSIQTSLVIDRASAIGSVRINEALLVALHDRLNAIAASKGLPPVSLEALLAVRGVVEADEGERPETDESALEQKLSESLREAVTMLADTRRTEGEALAVILADQLNRMAAGIASAASTSEAQSGSIKQRLQEQVSSLMDADGRFDQQRLHQEAVLLAARADIREELDRFGAHVEAARELLRNGGAIGRRLDFLAQELGRETNTICSKSGSLDLTAIGLDLKSLVEQFREQVQNVE